MKDSLLVSIFLIFSSLIYSQNFTYKSNQILIEDGLAHNSIEWVYKDHEGYMWFATSNGLNRFDGTEIKTYQNNPHDTTSLSVNKVNCINEDGSGNLWIGTLGGGLNLFDREKECFKHYTSSRSKNGLPNNTINNIKLLHNNELWICTANGLAHFNPKTNDFTNYFPKSKGIDLSQFYVTDIIQTKKGDIYIATGDHWIYKFNPDSGNFEVIHYVRDKNLMGDYRKFLAEDPEGNIWISAFSHGLIKYNPNTGASKIITPKNSNLNTDLLNGQIIVKYNKLWIPTDGFGIYEYDLASQKMTSISKDPAKLNSINSNIIYSLCIDNQNIIWAGSFNDGVNYLDPNQIKFTTLTSFDNKDLSFIGTSVPAIFEDSKGRIWIGTDGDGLYQYSSDGHLFHYKNEPNNLNSLSSDRIVSITEDHVGNILLGSFMGGMMIFNVEKNKFTRYLSGNSSTDIASNHVWDILMDSENRIWVGLLGKGLDLFNPKTQTFTHYGPWTDNYNRINHDNVMSIMEDKDGDLWFGTEGKGVNILDKQTRQMYPSITPSENIKISSNDVKCIYEDSKGIIWIGTVNGGLNRYDKKNQKIEYYSMDNGLPSNIIYSIVEDNDNNIWLGTAYGLSMFNTKTKKFRNYAKDDGLLGFVCNRKALCRLKNGNILVGTTNGLNIFNPDSIHDIKFKPKAFFTSLRIQNEVIEIGDTINGRVVLPKNINYLNRLVISPLDKIFTLEFAAKTFTLPEKCRFKYKLDGFEKTWKTTDAQRRYATYSNLDPGSYTFHIKASNSDGVWSNEETTLQITVLPSFVQSAWFKLILGIIVILIFYVWYRNKMNIKEKQFLNEKEKHQQQIVVLEKEKLESELNNQTFNILSRNRALLKHRRRLNSLVNKVDEKNKATLLEIMDEIDQEVNEVKDWKHIEPRLDKVYNNFMTSLKSKQANLTLTELRIAAYVRMGLSTKEISELLQKTTKAVDNERYRLRKKLDIPLNDSLKKYLLDL